MLCREENFPPLVPGLDPGIIPTIYVVQLPANPKISSGSATSRVMTERAALRVPPEANLNAYAHTGSPV